MNFNNIYDTMFGPPPGPPMELMALIELLGRRHDTESRMDIIKNNLAIDEADILEILGTYLTNAAETLKEHKKLKEEIEDIRKNKIRRISNNSTTRDLYEEDFMAFWSRSHRDGKHRLILFYKNDILFNDVLAHVNDHQQENNLEEIVIDNRIFKLYRDPGNHGYVVLCGTLEPLESQELLANVDDRIEIESNRMIYEDHEAREYDIPEFGVTVYSKLREPLFKKLYNALRKQFDDFSEIYSVICSLDETAAFDKDQEEQVVLKKEKTDSSNSGSKEEEIY